ncbi:hypothetical protein DFS34DRAFT_188276 [Phlyctochytrium arcticum]|nr:hypothetical protein DFS34DRAFT_188276 [Phlyctochytrium arcticum]
MSITKYLWSAFLGNVGGNTIPLHAIVTPVPSVLFPISFASDLVGLVIDRFPPNSVVATLGARGLYALSYYTTAAGLITSIPTLFTGLAEYFTISDVRAPEVKRKAFRHGIMNLAVAGISLFNFLGKRRSIDFAPPAMFNIALSGVGLVLAGWSAQLLGQIVFKYGVGVRRMGTTPAASSAPSLNPNQDLVTELGLPTIWGSCKTKRL